MPWRNPAGLVCVLHSTRMRSRLAGNLRALALPFSTQFPDRAVPRTFVQPMDCLMPNPRPGDTKLGIRNLWVEGRCDRTGTCAWLPPWKVNLQHAPVHRRRAENLPLPPPLRQGANLRQIRKPHLQATKVQAVTGGPLHRQQATGSP